ncbi:MAG: GNAT family N-acetyltransferase [Candidatus Izimaplasma sp.]|nr:GNAT family N-acetyltransferase [Candidatus Izimaplasma bacterium]
MKKITLPIITTKRLLLRPLKKTDKEAIFAYAKLPNVGPLAGWKPHDSIEDTNDFIKFSFDKQEFGQPGVYVITLKFSSKVIGTIELHSYKGHKAEIGFVLHPDYWNKGFITEAAKAIIIYGFEHLELRRIQYCHFPHNKTSEHLAQKLDFTYEGIMRNAFLLYTNESLDDVVYSITIQDYNNQQLSWLKTFKKTVSIDYD